MTSNDSESSNGGSDDTNSDLQYKYGYDDSTIPATQENVKKWEAFRKLLSDTIHVKIECLVNDKNMICSSHDGEKMLFRYDKQFWDNRDDGNHNAIADRFLTVAEYIFGKFPFEPNVEKIKCEGDKSSTFRMINLETKFFLSIQMNFGYFDYGIEPFSYHNEGLKISTKMIFKGLFQLFPLFPDAIQQMVERTISDSGYSHTYKEVVKNFKAEGYLSWNKDFQLHSLDNNTEFRIVFPVPAKMKRKEEKIISVTLPNLPFSKCVTLIEEGWKASCKKQKSNNQSAIEKNITQLENELVEQKERLKKCKNVSHSFEKIEECMTVLKRQKI